MIKKTIVIAGQQGERGDKAEEYSVPIDGVLGYTETGTPDGYVEAGYFKVTGLDEVDSRIDVIESLPEGSTSGDAEVADIRVGVDGEIYDSAGIAVRDQITELHDYAESIDDVQDAQIETLKVTKAVEGEYITINDAAALPANEYAFTLSPVQSLNGYDSPWVGGAGKNKFETTASTKTESGVVWTVNADGTISVSGTAIGYTAIGVGVAKVKPSMGKVTISGISEATNIAWNSVLLRDSNDNTLYQISSGGTYSSFTVDLSQYPTADNISVSLKRNNNCAVSGVIKPQVEVGEQATSFAPYSNICPIHGADEVGVRVCGKNLIDLTINSDTPNSRQVLAKPIPQDIVVSALADNVAVSESVWRVAVEYQDGTIQYVGDSGYALGTFPKAFTASEANPIVAIRYRGTMITSGSYSIQLELGSIPTPYEPYVLHSTTITLPSTVYGGSVDMGGSGTSEIALVDDSVITNITEGVDGNADWLNVKFTTSVSLLYPGSAEAREILAAKSKSNYSGFWVYQNVNGQIHFYSDRNAIYAFYPKSVFPTLSDFTTYYASNKAEFAIPLATPTDISVTPFPQTLLEGVNNVWAECSEDGEVIGDAQQDLTYQRDTTLVIQNLINRIEELERRN